MKSEAERVQVGVSWQDWGNCGDPGPQDAAGRASVKHQLVVFSINDGACGSFWQDRDDIDPGPGAETRTSWKVSYLSSQHLQFLLKCTYDLTTFLVHPSSGSTSYGKQNLNSSSWFPRPHLSWPHSPLLRLP